MKYVAPCNLSNSSSMTISVLNADLVQCAMIYTKPPRAVFPFNEKNWRGKWTENWSNDAGGQHLFDDSLNLVFLYIWVSIWPDIDWTSVGFQYNPMVMCSCQR